MTFKIGQKVVCINATCNSYRGNRPLQKGRVYTVDGNYTCGCGSKQVSITERPEVLIMHCGCSRRSVRRQTYYNWRFMPLDLLTKFISIPVKKYKEEELSNSAPEPGRIPN
jgi:hypothetical protein